MLAIPRQSAQSRVSNLYLKCCNVLAIPREHAQLRQKSFLWSLPDRGVDRICVLFI
jgi:hypothetical protein